MKELRLEVSGPHAGQVVRALFGAQTIRRFRTQKTAILLAYLAYFRGRSHPRWSLPHSEPPRPASGRPGEPPGRDR